jgi:hypothetical protein
MPSEVYLPVRAFLLHFGNNERVVADTDAEPSGMILISCKFLLNRVFAHMIHYKQNFV